MPHQVGRLASKARRDGGAFTTCPACARRVSRRCRRRRIVERVLALACISPFRCAACGFRFLAFHPGVRYRRRRVQRRAPERFAIGGPCVLEYEGERVAGQVVDLSMRGCAVTTDAAPPIGARVALTVQPAAGAPPLTLATATVRSVLPGRLGLEFEDLDQAAMSRLGSAVLAARGYAPGFVGGGRRGSRSRRSGALWRIAAAALIIAALALFT